MNRAEAIQAVYNLADTVECEFGYGSRSVAWHEANQILLALGVEPEELKP